MTKLLDNIFDGRRKLLPCQVERIKYLISAGFKATQIAREAFHGNISANHILVVSDPIKEAKQKLKARESNKNRKTKSADNVEKVKANRKKRKEIENTFVTKQSQHE